MMITIIGMATLGSEIVFLLSKHRQMHVVADASALSGATAVAFHFRPARGPKFESQTYSCRGSGNRLRVNVATPGAE
jgi:hypothetical protein